MKKVLFVILLVLLCNNSFGENIEEQPYIVRIGNSYSTGSTIMGKKEFLGYLQTRDAVSYCMFRSAYRLSNVGWGLFGGCFFMQGLGAAITMGTGNTIGLYCNIIGSVALIPGIVCISVGYGRMHKVPNTYNTLLKNRQTSVTFNIQSSQDGIGLVMKF